LSKLLELKEVYYEPMMASGLISPGQVEDVFQNMAKLITISITILEQCSHSDPISAIVAMSLDQVHQSIASKPSAPNSRALDGSTSLLLLLLSSPSCYGVVPALGADQQALCCLHAAASLRG
jgi:hypothetical protein